MPPSQQQPQMPIAPLKSTRRVTFRMPLPLATAAPPPTAGSCDDNEGAFRNEYGQMRWAIAQDRRLAPSLPPPLPPHSSSGHGAGGETKPSEEKQQMKWALGQLVASTSQPPKPQPQWPAEVEQMAFHQTSPANTSAPERCINCGSRMGNKENMTHGNCTHCFRRVVQVSAGFAAPPISPPPIASHTLPIPPPPSMPPPPQSTPATAPPSCTQQQDWEGAQLAWSLLETSVQIAPARPLEATCDVGASPNPQLFESAPRPPPAAPPPSMSSMPSLASLPGFVGGRPAYDPPPPPASSQSLPPPVIGAVLSESRRAAGVTIISATLQSSALPLSQKSSGRDEAVGSPPPMMTLLTNPPPPRTAAATLGLPHAAATRPFAQPLVPPIGGPNIPQMLWGSVPPPPPLARSGIVGGMALGLPPAAPWMGAPPAAPPSLVPPAFMWERR